MKKAADWRAGLALGLIGVASVGLGFKVAGQAGVAAAPPKQAGGDTEPAAGTGPRGKQAPFAYALEKPDQTFQLDEELNEISDLSPTADGESVWAVNDEKGILYRISLADGGVAERVEFHKKGDFEGVAVVDGTVIAGRSDGTLFVVDPKTSTETHRS